MNTLDEIINEFINQFCYSGRLNERISADEVKKWLNQVIEEYAQSRIIDKSEHYPKEYVEWIIRQVDLVRITRCAEGYQFVNLDEPDDNQLFKHITSDINDFYVYWKTNVKK